MKSKVAKREYTMGIRLKDIERRYLEQEAYERGQRLSEYVRDILLAAMSFHTPDDKIKA